MKKASKKTALEDTKSGKPHKAGSKKQLEPEAPETPNRVMGEPMNDISALEPEGTRRPRQQTTDLKSARKNVSPNKNHTGKTKK